MDITITDIVSLRDLVLVIWGVVGIIAAIVFIVVTIKLDRRLGPILKSARSTADIIKNTIALISDTVVDPLSSIYGWVKGGYEGFTAIAKVLQDKGKGKNE